MSEFGTGLSYCLGLFLAHAERNTPFSTNIKYEMWFYGASDHLFELQTKQAPKHLRKRLKAFQNKCIKWRSIIPSKYGKPTQKNFIWAVKEAKHLLMLIDKANGITVKRSRCM